MRIAMIVMNEFRPDVRVLKEAKSLVDAGHELLVVAIRRSRPSSEMFDGIRVNRLDVGGGQAAATTFSQSWRYLRFTWRVVQTLDSWRPDVCHAHDVTTLLPGYLAARRCQCPLIYDAHEFESGRQFAGDRIPPLMERVWTLPERLLIQRAAAVITVSDSIADALKAEYGVVRPTVVRNVPVWRKVPHSDLLWRELGVEEDAPILIYQGWLVPGRGLTNAIDSLAFLDNAVLAIIGTGPLLEQLKTTAKTAGVAERTLFTGRVKRDLLPLYTSSAKIGLHLLENTCLNHEYALPNKLFEYMAARLPIIVGQTLEMRRLVQAEEVGLSVDPNFPEQVAEAVDKLSSDSLLYQRFSANSVKAAKERYNWDRESQRLLDLYKQVRSTCGRPLI